MAILTLPAFLFAQETSTLALNTLIEDTFTGEPLTYALSLETTDPFIIIIYATDPLGNLQFPMLTVSDMDGVEIATTLGHSVRFGQTTHQATSFVTPPNIGDYQVRVDRLPETDSTGDFVLQVIQLEMLSSEQPISAQISNTDSYHFYLVKSETAFQIVYDKLSGDYAPEVRMNRVLENGELSGVGYLAGDELTHGTLGTYNANTSYVISIGWLTSSFLTNIYNPDIVVASYQLQLITE